MSEEMSIEEARMIVQSADEAAAALPEAEEALERLGLAVRGMIIKVDEAKALWEEACDEEYERVREEVEALERRGDEAGAQGVRERWNKRSRAMREGRTGKGLGKILKAEKERKEAVAAWEQAREQARKLKKVKENGWGRLEREAEEAEARQEAREEARQAWGRRFEKAVEEEAARVGLAGAPWHKKRAMALAAGVGADAQAWAHDMGRQERDKAVEEEARRAWDAVEAERKTMNEAWWSGGRLAAARRIVAAADDRAVLRQAAGLGPDADADSAPVRRRSTGGPKGGM